MHENRWDSVGGLWEHLPAEVVQYDNRHPQFQKELEEVAAKMAEDPATRASLGSPSVMVHVQLNRHVGAVPIRQVAEIQLYLAPSAAALPRFCTHAPSDTSRLRSLVFSPPRAPKQHGVSMPRFKDLEAITHQTYEISRSEDASTLTSTAFCSVSTVSRRFLGFRI